VEEKRDEREERNWDRRVRRAEKKMGMSGAAMELGFLVFTASLFFSVRKPLLSKLFQNHRIINGTE
jgi:hypothetical protein